MRSVGDNIYVCPSCIDQWRRWMRGDAPRPQHRCSPVADHLTSYVPF